MAEIINLKRARKRKTRDEKAVEAGENRLKFGRSKADKQLDKAKADLARKSIEAHKRDD